MSNATKRIPVTEERWRELNELKGAGETYDDLLRDLIQEHLRRQLAERATAVREAALDDLTSLDELCGPHCDGRLELRRRVRRKKKK